MIPKFCKYSNIVRTGTITTGSGTVDTTYPKENLVDGDPSNPMKFTTSVAATILFDYASAQRVDAVVVPMHNMAPGSIIYWQANTINDFTTPALSTQITVPAWDLDAFAPSVFLDLTGVSGYSPTGYRYQRLVVSDFGTPQQIGEIIVCKQLETFTYNWIWGGDVTEQRWLNQQETEFGYEFIKDMGVKRRGYELSFETSRTGLTQLRDLWRDARGGRYGWVLIPQADVATSEAFFCRFVDESARMFTYQDTFLDDVRVNLNVREIYRGLQL